LALTLPWTEREREREAETRTERMDSLSNGRLDYVFGLKLMLGNRGIGSGDLHAIHSSTVLVLVLVLAGGGDR
jgi:hypothetical protein